MRNSIENTWKTGFEKETEITGLKEMNFEEKRSKLLMDKMWRMYRIDNASLPFIALLSIIAGYIWVDLWLGIYVASLLTALFFLNRSQFRKLKNVKLNDDLYHYLRNYREVIQGMIRFYKKLLGIGMPLLVIPALLVIAEVKFPGALSEMLTDSPFHTVGILLLLALVLSGLGIGSYGLSTQALYGKHLQNLDKIISDISKLR